MIGILLAAGFSRRFGEENKLLQCLPDGRAMALASAQHLLKALPVSVAVLRPEDNALAALLTHAGLAVIHCEQDAQHMSDSLRTAVRYSASLEAANDGFVIALADMPYIAPKTIGLVAQHVQSGASIVVPTFEGQRGHPVGFSAKLRSDFAQIRGDEGARSIIKQHAQALVLLPTNDAGILIDIDTKADLSVKF